MADDSRPRRTITYDVADGDVVPDVSTLDAPLALARKRELEQQLAATRGDSSRARERKRLLAEDLAVSRRLSELREAHMRENSRRNFAGIGAPLHEAVVARFDAGTVAALEADALARLMERERRSAEAAKVKAANVDAPHPRRSGTVHSYAPPKPAERSGHGSKA